jgi:hypothetical protein
MTVIKNLGRHRIEVRAVATVTSKEAAKFIEDITHRFGVPN